MCARFYAVLGKRSETCLLLHRPLLLARSVPGGDGVQRGFVCCAFVDGVGAGGY